MEFVIIGGAILIAWIIVWLIVGIIAGTVTSVQESMKKTGGAGFFGFLRFLSSLAIAAAAISLSFLIGASPKILGMGRSTAISIAVFFGFVGCILFCFFPAPPRIAEGPTTLRIWGRLLWMLFLEISGAALYIAAQNRDIVSLRFAICFGIVGIINFISFPLSRDYRGHACRGRLWGIRSSHLATTVLMQSICFLLLQLSGLHLADWNWGHPSWHLPVRLRS